MNELWRDYSANQDLPDTPRQVDVSVAKANGVVGVISRAGSSWTYTDPTFADIYRQAGELNLYRSSYWNFSPGANISAQIDRWIEAHTFIDVIPRFAAVEINWNNLEPPQIAYEFKKFSDDYLSLEGERPGIYTRKQLADLWLTPFLDEDFLNEHWWWIAQYDARRDTEQLDKPMIPPDKVDISRCWLRQTADQMAGFPGEAESSHVDRDRFMFDNMDAWITANFGETNNGGDITNPVGDCCEELETRVFDRIVGIEYNYDCTINLAKHNATDIKNLEAQAIFWDLNIDSLNALAEEVDDCVDAGAYNLLVDRVAELEKKLKAIGDRQAVNEEISDLQDDLIDLNRDDIKKLQTKTIPECNHSHRKLFSWLFNRRYIK